MCVWENLPEPGAHIFFPRPESSKPQQPFSKLGDMELLSLLQG